MLLRGLYSLAFVIAALAASDESSQHGQPSHPSKPEPSHPSKPEPSHPSKPEPSHPSKPEPSQPSKTGLGNIKHVVFMMQENRAFDHYFGTMAGVRGFKDPNVQINAEDAKMGLPNVYFQHVDKTLTNASNFLLPFYANAQGGDSFEATQCAVGGTNALKNNLAADNNGLNNMWPVENTPGSMTYFKKGDIPVQWALSELWTIADMHQEAMVAATHPNRAYMYSGSAGLLGGNVAPGLNGPSMDDNEFPQGEMLGIDNETVWNTFPYEWNTTAHYLEREGVSWHVYQSNLNRVDDGFFYFGPFQRASTQDPSGPLAQKGLTAVPGQLGYIEKFKADAMSGNLPAISYIVTQDQLTEHPPDGPRDGGWQQKAIIDALVGSPSYKDSALFITYDETGGWWDHVTPYHSPPGTPGEWLRNPFTLNQTFAGPGYRVPAQVISPWSRGPRVFTEKCDHNSYILFMEKWVKETMGKDIFSFEINDWRREHMCDYTNVFDFDHADFSVQKLPEAAFPPFDNATQMFNGAALCDAKFPDPQPIIPYGKQNEATALFTETGFRAVSGIMTEGRYLLFQEVDSSKGLAVQSTRGRSSLGSSSVPSKKESDSALRMIIWEEGDFPNLQYKIQSAMLKDSSSSYLDANLEFTSKEAATAFMINYTAAGSTYTIQVESSNKFVSIDKSGKVSLSLSPTHFSVYAVSF